MRRTLSILLTATFASLPGVAVERPNILWLSSEDNGPALGAYGDRYAETPNLDALAARGMRYQRVWSNAPVCAPARTTIISGLYPTSTGSEHMRSLARLPEGFRFFPQLLREHGYYTTNHRKEDFNLETPGPLWDDGSADAHWRHRPPGTPFFSVFNFTITHESQIRKRPYTPHHDPASAPLPPYHPDTPEVRLDWAQYYDRMTEMDAQAGAHLRELEEAGLDESTIVFYWGDHGVGLPRGKRTALDTGLRVPLIVYVPPKFRSWAGDAYSSGSASQRLVAFVDFAPTVLSLAGIEPPSYYQGTAFLGPHTGPPKLHLFGFRGRMDERYDLVRSVTDGRFVYARNFMPHRIYAAHVEYMFLTPTTQEWLRLHRAGQLDAVQSAFWGEKPVEELYDLSSDPHQVHNLASEGGSSLSREAHASLRSVLLDHLRTTRDLGLLSESEVVRLGAEHTPYRYGETAYEIEPLLELALLATDRGSVGPEVRKELIQALTSTEPGMAMWAARGLRIRGADAMTWARSPLRQALVRAPTAARIEAAEALGLFGDPGDLESAIQTLLTIAEATQAPESRDLGASANLARYYDAVAALDALDLVLGARRGAMEELTLDELGPRIEQLEEPAPERRGTGYIDRLTRHIGQTIDDD